MSSITPHLWFNQQAKEATTFYTTIFPDSRITSIKTITGTPSGDCDMVSFELLDTPFMAISAGPYFTFNPAISFMVNFDGTEDERAAERIDEIWGALVEGGKVLMPLDKYPFSERYGWVEDRFGVSWQLILTKPEGEVRPRIMPSLLFVGDMCGLAGEATNFYLTVFKDSERGALIRYSAGMEPDQAGTIMFTDYKLANHWFVAMDSAREHDFAFNEAISFIINCETQAEIDYYWEKLSAVPAAEQCGWLKDRFGVSWQVVPTRMNEMMASGSKEQTDRVTEAFLQMKKFDLTALEAAFDGK